MDYMNWGESFNTTLNHADIISSNCDVLTGVLPYRWPYVKHLVQEVPQKLWEFLHDE